MKKLAFILCLCFLSLVLVPSTAIGEAITTSGDVTVVREDAALYYILRHAKILRAQIETNSYTDEALRNRIQIIVSLLKKSDAIEDPKKISEVYDLVPKIDENRFKEEKELLQKALKEVTSKP